MPTTRTAAWLAAPVVTVSRYRLAVRLAARKSETLRVNLRVANATHTRISATTPKMAQSNAWSCVPTNAPISMEEVYEHKH